MSKSHSAGIRRKRACLITNHGYAQPKVTVTVDTGGQVFYVNDFAMSLVEYGYDVIVFARGGFPQFDKPSVQRVGDDPIGPHAKYVYIDCGPPEFIPKEEIGYVINEEANWLDHYVRKIQGEEGGSSNPWEYFDFISTHYWDAAILAIRLQERWVNNIILDSTLKHMKSIVGEEKKEFVEHLIKSKIHEWEAFRNPTFFLGKVIIETFQVFNDGILSENSVIERFQSFKSFLPQGWLEEIEKFVPTTFPESKVYPAIESVVKGKLNTFLGDMFIRHFNLYESMIVKIKKVQERHVWTPHSLGVLKERNYTNVSHEKKRKFRFLERKAVEDRIFHKTKKIVSTSPLVSDLILGYYSKNPEDLIFFPPCISAIRSKRKEKENCQGCYKFLSEKSGLDVEVLKNSLIIVETSRIAVTKRKDLILKSFEKMLKNLSQPKDIYLFIGGGPSRGDLYEGLKLLTNREGLKGRGFLVGFIPEELMSEFMIVGDIFVTPSEMEGFGMSLMEASYFGCATISSTLVPFATSFLKDENCMIVKAGDEDGFADAMGKLVLNPMLREKISKGGALISEGFTYEKMTKEFLVGIEKL